MPLNWSSSLVSVSGKKPMILMSTRTERVQDTHDADSPYTVGTISTRNSMGAPFMRTWMRPRLRMRRSVMFIEPVMILILAEMALR